MMKRKRIVLGLLLLTGIACPAWSQEPNKEKAAMTSGQDYTDSLVSVVLQGENVGSPRITVAPDGRLLVCAQRLKPGPATLLLYASGDLGKTWDEIHDFERPYYGPSFFTVGDTLYLLLRDTAPETENLILAASADAGKTWRKTALLPPCQTTPEVPFTAGRTTGNTPVLVTGKHIIAAVSDWGGRGDRFPQAGRIACGWCPVESDPMEPGNWTWTDFLEMPDPSSAPQGKGGWLEPNPVIAPSGELMLLVRVDSADGELGAMVQIDMKARQLRFEDRFPAQPGQTGFFRMPGGGNGMFFVGYDEPSRRYLCVANPRTGGATELWGHTRIRNCLALFESSDLYDWKWVRALVRDDQRHDWKASATTTGFQQPSWVRIADDLYIVSRTAYGHGGNWHDANLITLHKLADYRRYLDADGEVARYRFDQPEDLGFDSSRQGGNKADIHGVTYDPHGRHGGCARFDGNGHLDLRYRVSSEFHYATQVGVTFWIQAEELNGQIIDFPIDGTKNGFSIALRDGMLLVGGRSCARDAWQSVRYSFPGADVWNHVAVQVDYNRNRIQAWVNGEKIGEAAEVQFALDHYQRGLPGAFDVVGRSHNRQAPFVGRLDDLRFFRRPLTVAEIQGAEQQSHGEDARPATSDSRPQPPAGRWSPVASPSKNKLVELKMTNNPLKHINLPIVDLSKQTGRHVFVARGSEAEWNGHPSTVLLPDGKTIFCVWQARRDGTRKHGAPGGYMKRSDDEGETWTAPRELPLALTGDRHLPRYAPDSRLVIVFRPVSPGDAKTLSAYPDGYCTAWVGRYEDIVAGREGECLIRLLRSYRGADHTYPGFELLSDGTFVATTYIQHRPDELQSIVSVRFRVAETDMQPRESSPKRIFRRVQPELSSLCL